MRRYQLLNICFPNIIKLKQRKRGFVTLSTSLQIIHKPLPWSHDSFSVHRWRKRRKITLRVRVVSDFGKWCLRFTRIFYQLSIRSGELIKLQRQSGRSRYMKLTLTVTMKQNNKHSTKINAVPFQDSLFTLQKPGRSLFHCRFLIRVIVYVIVNKKADICRRFDRVLPFPFCRRGMQLGCDGIRVTLRANWWKCLGTFPGNWSWGGGSFPPVYIRTNSRHGRTSAAPTGYRAEPLPRRNYRQGMHSYVWSSSLQLISTQSSQSHVFSKHFSAVQNTDY